MKTVIKTFNNLEEPININNLKINEVLLKRIGDFGCLDSKRDWPWVVSYKANHQYYSGVRNWRFIFIYLLILFGYGCEIYIIN